VVEQGTHKPHPRYAVLEACGSDRKLLSYRLYPSGIRRMSDLEEISAFRNRLVEFANCVSAAVSADPYRYGNQLAPATPQHINAEQVALTQEYGRLRGGITAAAGGISQMTLPMLGGRRG
jgi:hypothetical protein